MTTVDAMFSLGLNRGERRTLALMGALVAVLLCAYTIAKVMRDALFLQEFGALDLPFAYVGVAFASLGYVWLDERVARRLSYRDSSRLNQYLAIVLSALAAAALPVARHWTALFVYLWTGSQALMLLPSFWALALDLWDSRRARLLFPLLTGCGLLGGLAGGGIAASTLPVVHHVGLMWIVSALLAVATALTAVIERRSARVTRPSLLTSKLSSWEIFKQSRYVKILVTALVVATVVGTLIDFQFKLLVQRMYPEPHALTRFLGAFYAGLNGVSLLFQFGVAGWLLRRVGLRVSTALQPGALLVLAVAAIATTGGWAIVAMRWVQGVISQTLGKSSTEIYYAAIDPGERRRIKPALDTLVERWSDALVGVLLIVALRILHVPIEITVAVTLVLSALWLVMLVVLDRQNAEAFREALSRSRIDVESALESMGLPSSRASIQAALASENVQQVRLALKLCQYAVDGDTKAAVRRCLSHPSPDVRAAAADAMTTMRLQDPDRTIEGFLSQPDEEPRRAAVAYLLSERDVKPELVRGWLQGDDASLKEHALAALGAQPTAARRVLRWDWIDDRLKSARKQELLLAAQALGAMEAPANAPRLAQLLAHPDVEIQRAALQSAARRPSREVLNAVAPLLTSPVVGYEASDAVAAAGDIALPVLSPLLRGERGPLAQRRAARSVACIRTRRAVRFLLAFVRADDASLRHLALNGIARVRARTGRAMLPRPLVHRLFLRELREYRLCFEPVAALEGSDVPELRLLGESYRESADQALERALEALACWYDTKPLFGVYARLKSRELAASAPALEYLTHILPAAVFRSVARIFEKEAIDPQESKGQGDRLEEWIGRAWDRGDAWLQACAVRASRRVPGFDPGRFTGAARAYPVVRAELEALA